MNKKAPLNPIAKSFFNEILFFDIKVLDGYPCGEYKGILILVEGFSKYVTLCPIKTHSSIEIMTNIFRNYISKWGVPSIIITDQEKS